MIGIATGLGAVRWPRRELRGCYTDIWAQRRDLHFTAAPPSESDAAKFRNHWPALHKTQEQRSLQMSIFRDASHPPYSLDEKTTCKQAVRKLRIASSGRRLSHASEDAPATRPSAHGQTPGMPREGKPRRLVCRDPTRCPAPWRQGTRTFHRHVGSWD